jgi:phage repressor protein C with HTH and peptisase S24 domain
MDVRGERAGEMVYIPYFGNAFASAGDGAINYDEAPKVMAFDHEFLKARLGITSYKNLFIMNVIGNSMEPTLKSGELIFVNPIENEGFIVTGGIYVVVLDGDCMIKRIKKDPIKN